MAVSINWPTGVISVPQADLTLVSGTIYSMDTDQFRLDLKALEASVDGMGFLKTHIHNTEVTVAGTTFARALEILLPYSVEFEDGQYTVILQGSNNNIFDVASGILVQNQVQIISTNSAGLISTVSGSGVTAQDKIDIVTGVWNTVIENSITAEESHRIILGILAGKTTITDIGGGSASVVFRDTADTKDRVIANMSGSERTAITIDKT